jgi:hypothetical protein
LPKWWKLTQNVGKLPKNCQKSPIMMKKYEK